ncbi:acetyltransferase [Clostridium polyendosporum]|uniref:Acetyltransferase n=1 Tax=Clostridium polyendosporum TaxID=69208 RepID=A0A919VHD5_9CLOT|nr:N-acetyltransferase [Clostridium polyendosporum]GIM30285.1 acetyltransferase [Clostridium polyendosporum]
MIKQLETFEIEEVMDIWLKTNITAHSFITEKYWIDNYNVVKEMYIPISTTFVYKEDNRIKAFISIINNLFIGALFVLDDYQGQGIGRKLLEYSKSLYSSLELGVYTENINAVNFYKHCGFVVKTEQPNEDSGFIEYTMCWTSKDNH